MQFRDKNMRKGNLTNWIAVLCLAAAGMPAAAQQSPSVLTRVRSLLGQTPAPKPAAAPAPAPKPAPPAPAPTAPAPAQAAKPATSAASPAPVQNSKPMAAATAPINRPLAPAMKAVSAPAAPNAPAASTESRGPFTPKGKPPIKTVAEVPGVKGVPAKGLKPEGAKSKLISTTPNPKAAAEVKAEEPKDVPRDIPKADALPAIVPVKENIARRDPFDPLLARKRPATGHRSIFRPAKPGLMIGTFAHRRRRQRPQRNDRHRLQSAATRLFPAGGRPPVRRPGGTHHHGRDFVSPDGERSIWQCRWNAKLTKQFNP